MEHILYISVQNSSDQGEQVQVELIERSIIGIDCRMRYGYVSHNYLMHISFRHGMSHSSCSYRILSLELIMVF